MAGIITGRVFWTEFPELSYTDKKGKVVRIKETTAKIVLLAIADSAGDFGENSWQSFETISQKASIERRSAIRVVRALVANGYLKIEGKTKYGTNNFTVNLEKLGNPPPKRAKVGRPKTSDSEANIGDSETVIGDSEAKTSDPQSPDPLNNLPNPPIKNIARRKANTYPELVTFREVTKRYPQEVNWQDVIGAFQKVNIRLGRDATRDDLMPFYKFWCGKGYNPLGLGWLEWAVRGQTPPNGKVAEQWQNAPVGVSVAQRWLAGKEAQNVGA